MKALIIIGGICLYLVFCFFFWAIIYVGTGGKVPLFKRRAK